MQLCTTITSIYNTYRPLYLNLVVGINMTQVRGNGLTQETAVDMQYYETFS